MYLNMLLTKGLRRQTLDEANYSRNPGLGQRSPHYLQPTVLQIRVPYIRRAISLSGIGLLHRREFGRSELGSVWASDEH